MEGSSIVWRWIVLDTIEEVTDRAESTFIRRDCKAANELLTSQAPNIHASLIMLTSSTSHPYILLLDIMLFPDRNLSSPD